MTKARGGLGKWFSEKWVDVSRRNPDGSHPPCGRSDTSKGGYPKCAPASRAAQMSDAEKESATRRKRAAEAKKPAGQKTPAYVATKKGR